MSKEDAPDGCSWAHTWAEDYCGMEKPLMAHPAPRTLSIGTVILNGASIVDFVAMAEHLPSAYYHAICVRPGMNHHNYAVWRVSWSEMWSGWDAGVGTYYHTLSEALTGMHARSGNTGA